MLDLIPLNCLKSLVLECYNWELIGRHGKLSEHVSMVDVRGLGTLKSVGFLAWTYGYIDSAHMEDIACLTSLEYLGHSCIKCEKLPDLSNLKLLRAVQFDIEGETCELSGLSSKMTRLKRLILKFDSSIGLKKLTTCTCHGISNLMALEELEIKGAVNVEEMFNLQMLANLQRLTISGCDSIKELRGFDDLVALNSFHLRGSAILLEELRIANCCNLRKLPHVGKLTNLRILDISLCCSLQSLQGLGELVAVEVLVAFYCSKPSEIPDLHKLSNLQKLDLRWCTLRTVRGSVHHCGKLVALPELCKLRDLGELDISHCINLKSLPSLESLNNLRVLKGDWQMVLEPHKLSSRLDELTIYGWGSKGLQSSASLKSRLDCRDLDELNSLPTLPAVYSLKLERCNFRAVLGLINGIMLQKLDIKKCRELEGLPDLPHLKTLHIELSMTKVVINMGFLPELECLSLQNLAIAELPDLSSCCPKLTHLGVYKCKELRNMTSSAPLIALTSFKVRLCGSLRELRDLRLSTILEDFQVWYCGIRLTSPKVKSSDICRSRWPDVGWEAQP